MTDYRPHKHKWVTTKSGPWMVPLEQVCECGMTRKRVDIPKEKDNHGEPIPGILEFNWVQLDGQVGPVRNYSDIYYEMTRYK